MTEGVAHQARAAYRMTTERASDRELVVTRTVDAPPDVVWKAWTNADLFRRWWVPKSLGLTLTACELDVREGGSYRLVFEHPAAPDGMVFHGRYVEVTPPSRLVWTNDEAGADGQVTTVTFKEDAGRTRVVVRDLYPTKRALDEALESGSTGWNDESFAQLEDVLSGAAG